MTGAAAKPDPRPDDGGLRPLLEAMRREITETRALVRADIARRGNLTELEKTLHRLGAAEAAVRDANQALAFGGALYPSLQPEQARRPARRKTPGTVRHPLLRAV